MVKERKHVAGLGGLDRVEERVNEMANVIAQIARLPFRGRDGELTESPVEAWFDERYLYLSVLCADAAACEADVFLGHGRAFLRVERNAAMHLANGNETTPLIPANE